MNIVFFGASKFVYPLLDALSKKYTVSLIVTTETNEHEAVSTYAKKHGIPLLSVKKIDDYSIERIRAEQAKLAVLAYFGIIVPKQLLEVFPKGIINTHPSLLPKYRGPTPVQTALVNGDTVTGVSIMKLDEEIDHGPILAQAKEPILPTDTSESLYKKLFTKGATLLSSIVQIIELKGATQEKPQDHKKATFTQELTRQSGYIDSNNPPSPEIIDRMIRAYYPWPGVWTRLKFPDGKEKIIKLLPEQKLQVEGKKPVSYKDFVNGYPMLNLLLIYFFSDLAYATIFQKAH